MTDFPLVLLFQFAFFSAILSFLAQQTHMLMSLLCLEGMMLNLVLLLPMMLYMNMMPIPTLSIILLTLGACEASLGLSIMVNMSRSYGSDMMHNLTMNKC